MRMGVISAGYLLNGQLNDIAVESLVGAYSQVTPSQPMAKNEL